MKGRMVEEDEQGGRVVMAGPAPLCSYRLPREQMSEGNARQPVNGAGLSSNPPWGRWVRSLWWSPEEAATSSGYLLDSFILPPSPKLAGELPWPVNPNLARVRGVR